jgi:glycosyltransferase involved in cell wall biosynthesis
MRWCGVESPNNGSVEEAVNIVCVIPARDEVSSVGAVVKKCKAYCSKVLVVDDGSVDGTGDVALEAVAVVIRHDIDLGYGAALSTGILAASGMGAEVVIILDADGQHDPDDIPTLLGPLFSNEADIVVGSRFLGSSDRMPFPKRIGNRILSHVATWRSKHNITDSQSGFRAFKVGAIHRFASQSADDYFWASEALIRTARAGARIKEVPVRSIYTTSRNRGTSIVDGIKIFIKTIRT